MVLAGGKGLRKRVARYQGKSSKSLLWVRANYLRDFFSWMREKQSVGLVLPFRLLMQAHNGLLCTKGAWLVGGGYCWVRQLVRR